MTPRRELVSAVLGAAGAGALTLIVSGQDWARVTAERARPLPPVTGVLTGGGAVPLVSACGLLLLAAALAIVAVSGLGRSAVGLLVVVAGAALGWSGVRALSGGLVGAAAEVPGVSRAAGPVAVHVTAVWPALVALAGVLGVVTGALVVLRGRAWPAMGRRYERPGGAAPVPAREPTDEERATAAWRALDRGEDPTAR